jgi:hypothetical protein
MPRPSPCGTRAAERRHRRNGQWPCPACLVVRTDIAEQITASRANAVHAMCQQIRCPSSFTDADRLELARGVYDMAPPVAKFAYVLGLPLSVGERLFTALSNDDDRRPA